VGMGSPSHKISALGMYIKVLLVELLLYILGGPERAYLSVDTGRGTWGRSLTIHDSHQSNLGGSSVAFLGWDFFGRCYIGVDVFRGDGSFD
jgi:hypothetical protein